MSFAYRISAFNRRRKWRRFMRVFQPTPELKVLDVGFTDAEYSDTNNFLEKNYPWLEQVTALGIDEPCHFPKNYPQVRAVQYDGAEFPFEDQEFDICWSNAVIEHVGSRSNQLRFLKEIKRVSRSALVTTPNRHFPIEVHTRTPLLHFLPKPWFEAYLRRIGMTWATGDYMNLLSARDLRHMLAEAGVAQYDIHRNRLGLFTLDFVITWGVDKLVERRGKVPEVQPVA